MKFLLAIIYFFIEIFCIVEFADEFGILSLFLEMIITAILGFGILLSQASTLPNAYNEILSGGISNFIGRNLFRLIGAVMLIIPGILCDIVGISFVFISLFFKTKETRYEYKKDDDSDIIDVEIIEDKK
ncbi:FxsA family protein [Helicobacter sp. MIT 99-5507]|uniref:FxsA family protein n=1 Tax=Helicobacter sp. MIT 99-5507 TaxID=152489 RepID=UPI000E1EB9AE|nr:FxsA family protein [Helicobacter sp. MIT 99-5507]RDU56681.1 hypothetical protein CQA42_07670 [Helicobacter sp. MIT 99-5507]